MKKLLFILNALCLLVCFLPAQSAALVIQGPLLDQVEEGWNLFGLLIRAEKDVILESVHYPNQGFADLIETRLHADGTTICATPVPAGEYDAIVALNCPLVAGEEYEIVSTTANNSYWVDFTGWPVGNEEITVLSSVGNHLRFPYSSYWFAFEALTTQPDSNTLVMVDVKPGSDQNPVNLKSKGMVTVAIFSSVTFDATSVDLSTVVCGTGNATESHGKMHIEDINFDGLQDLILHFRTQEIGLKCGDEVLSLSGETIYGEIFEGADSITIQGCK